MIRWIQEHKNGLYSLIGYLTFAVVLVTVFVYLTFPWEKLSRFIEFQVEEALDSSIEIKKSEFHFPLRLVWSGVAFRPRERQKALRVDLDQISLEWTVKRFLQRRLEVLWSVRLAGGEGNGQIAAQPTEKGMQYRFEGNIRGVQLGRILEFGVSNPYKIEGAVQISNVRHDWVGENFIKGSGAADLSMTDTRFEVETPLGKFPMAFNQVSGHVSMSAGMAQLDDVLAQGPALDLTGSGNVLFRPRLEESLINLNSRATVRDPKGPLAMLGNLSPKGGAGGTTEFSLRGTFKRPTLFVNGTAYSLSAS